jgi:glycosyltransferase involved in cell wall biosynthesis
MATGLPVITSNNNGGAQIITDGADGFIMQNAEDADALATLLAQLGEDADLRNSIGQAAAQTAQQYTWNRNAMNTWEFLQEALHRKAVPQTRAL